MRGKGKKRNADSSRASGSCGPRSSPAGPPTTTGRRRSTIDDREIAALPHNDPDSEDSDIKDLN